MKHVVTVWHEALGEVEGAFGGTRLETVAFGFAGRLISSERVGLLIDRVELVPEKAYVERTEFRFSLDPPYVAGVAMDAEAAGRSLVLMHSHPGTDFPTDFSPVDDRMHRRLIPNFLSLLPGPVASLVWSGGGWNGRVWSDGEDPRQLDMLRVVGTGLDLRFPPGLGPQLDDAEEWERQIRAFGQPAQRRLRALRVGIVGCGGTGSLACEWLAHMGVQDFVVVDAQALERSNLSRVTGSRPGDVQMQPALAKVTSVARMVTAIRPEARIQLYQRSVVECEALRALRDCDVILICSDGHASRAAVNPLAFQYGIPIIDIGTLLRGAAGNVQGAYAEVRLVAPGTACLRCQGVINPDRVREEELPAEERAVLERFGYAPGLQMPAPSVLPLNALAVSLALLRLLDLVEPWLAWEHRVAIESAQLVVRESSDARREGCDICATDDIRGRGDDVPLACRN